MIRGENLVLLGELDMEKEAQGTALREVPLEQIMAQKAAQKQEKVRVCKTICPRRWALSQHTDRGNHPPYASVAFPPRCSLSLPPPSLPPFFSITRRRRMTYCERNFHNKPSALASKTASEAKDCL